MEPAHLEAVHQARLNFAKSRQPVIPLGVYRDIRAVLHVHAEDAEHTKGTRAEVLAGAKQAGLQAVFFTDHRGPKPDAWRGVRDGVLFVPGSEDDHQLRFPVPDMLKFLSHVEERPDAPSDGFDGMEIYNRHADQTDETEFNRFFQAAMSDPAAWAKLVDAQKRYPDEVFNAAQDYWPAIFARWDKELEKRIFTGIAANDSHKNQAFLGTVFDPYEVSFRSAVTHILAREVTEAALRRSLREGRAYVAHDWLADPTGFVFAASNNLGVYQIGDSIPLFTDAKLTALLPLPAKLKLIHNGKIVREANGAKLEYTTREPGYYRLEAWLEVDGELRPWIYANPIFVAANSNLKLPAGEISENVEVRRGIEYASGAAEDASKHKLDVYLPKGKTNVPVFVFIHGGSWKQGDRSQYGALGNRLAREGIAMVVPSYRLAPKNLHPAQIDDVRAAFRWTVAHLGDIGGDPARVYVGGHSAGGHLSSLLALTEPGIRGVASLSGVYDVTGIEKVFTADPAVRKDASPINHVKAGAPPFLITYCQWDYAALPQQAEQFAAALKQAGVKVNLVYIPNESHISEIVNASKESDPTLRALLDFIK
jgi:acetyl esterase/lipase